MNKIRSPPDYLQPKNTMEEDKMENDYKRNYFWIKRDLKGNRHYYFKIKGQYHEVSEEVYKLVIIHLKKKNVKKKREVS